MLNKHMWSAFMDSLITWGPTRLRNTVPCTRYALSNKKPVLFTSEKSPLFATHIYIILKVAQHPKATEFNYLCPSWCPQHPEITFFQGWFFFRDKKNVCWQKVRCIRFVAGLHQAINCQEALHYNGRVINGTGLHAEPTIIIWKMQPHSKNPLQQLS